MKAQEAISTKFYDKRNPGKQYSIKLWDGDPSYDPDTVLVQSLKDVLDRYPYTPEKKMVDRYGEPCSRSTLGILCPPTILFDEVKYMGKEVNFLEERAAGLVEPEDLLNVYPPNRWVVELFPRLLDIPTNDIMTGTGLSHSAVTYYKSGKRRRDKRQSA